MINYGENLKYQREGKGLSTLALERETGISHQNIERWEKNRVLPNIDFCVQLADFYGISLDELVGRDNYVSQKAISDEKIDKTVIAKQSLIANALKRRNERTRTSHPLRQNKNYVVIQKGQSIIRYEVSDDSLDEIKQNLKSAKIHNDFSNNHGTINNQF